MKRQAQMKFRKKFKEFHSSENSQTEATRLEDFSG